MGRDRETDKETDREETPELLEVEVGRERDRRMERDREALLAWIISRRPGVVPAAVRREGTC